MARDLGPAQLGAAGKRSSSARGGNATGLSRAPSFFGRPMYPRCRCPRPSSLKDRCIESNTVLDNIAISAWHLPNLPFAHDGDIMYGTQAAAISVRIGSDLLDADKDGVCWCVRDPGPGNELPFPVHLMHLCSTCACLSSLLSIPFSINPCSNLPCCASPVPALFFPL